MSKQTIDGRLPAATPANKTAIVAGTRAPAVHPALLALARLIARQAARDAMATFAEREVQP